MDDQLRAQTLLATQMKQEIAFANLLNVADMAINRTYLAGCTRYDVANLPRDENGKLSTSFSSCTKLFRLKRFVYNPEESIMERLKTFYLSLSHLPLNPSVFMVIRNTPPTRDDRGKFDLYLGIRTEDVNTSYQIEEMLSESFLGTFLGSELIPAELNAVFPKLTPPSLSCVSAMPSVKKDADDTVAKLGLEVFIDVMQKKEYTAILIATPVANSVIQQRKRDLENLYTKLSVGRKQTISFGENQSQAVTEGVSHSLGTSSTSGTSFTTTRGRSSTFTQGSSDSQTSGSNSSTSYGSAGSSGSSDSRTTTTNWSTSETMNFSTSEGTSFTKGETSTDSTNRGRTDTKGTSRQFTLESENKNIVDMLSKIDEALKHTNESEAYGLWECAAYFLAKDAASSLFAANAYKALALGDTSSSSNSYVTTWSVPMQPLPGQSYDHFVDAKTKTKKFLTELYSYVKLGIHPTLTSATGYYNNDNLFRQILPSHAVSGKDLPYFLSMPLKSIPGVIVDSIASFERSVHVKALPNAPSNVSPKNVTIDLGNIFHMGKEEDFTTVSLELDNLTKHCFISGSTGSGKSNTMAQLLNEIIGYKDSQIGFLIVEPAKGEYKKDFHEVPDINIFTTNPFCEQLLHLNPFRFHPNIHVLEHVDRLLNVFGSCWELTAAMPAILKKAVEQSYEAMGWDLCGSYYLGAGEPQFPTFATLVEELRRIINESDYSSEVKGNYTGALVTRVESLAGGIMRRIFCNEIDISYKKLFDSRTIVDLSRLGSQETKTLIMGILVMSLAEYRMAVAQEKNETNSPLKHITVIEEAHNLLKNTANVSGGSDIAAKSIEMINNAIAEMRTYGEGFIIVDQSPTAVDISVIKNTNTKIVMRLPERHDCEAMASATGLNEFQQKEIAKLLPGKAIVMQSDWTAAVMVAIHKAKTDFSGRPEMISSDASRIVRSCLAYAVAHIARLCYTALPNDSARLTPTLKIAGGTVSEWWNQAMIILQQAMSAFKENPKQGIGRAKAYELRDLCAHYINHHNLKTLARKEILTVYGRLLISILECEGCWKHYLSKNPAAVSGQKDPLAKKCKLPPLPNDMLFKDALARYIAQQKGHENNFEMMCTCIKNFIATPQGIAFLGGTQGDLEIFKSLIANEKQNI